MRSTKINLKQSICTDTPVGADLWQLGDDAARHLVNTGMERNGGLTPIYEKETTFATAGASTMIAKDGTVIEVDASNNVRLNDLVIGNVGPLAIYKRGVLPGYLDAAWTADATIITVNRAGNVISVYEINPATGAILHSRNITFAGMPTGPIISFCLVKYVDMHYVDTQEFIIFSAGTTTSYILKEAGTSVTAIATVPAFKMSFCWRFAAAKYIMGEQHHWWFIGDPVTAMTSIGGSTNNDNCVIIDRFVGTAFSRAIMTRSPERILPIMSRAMARSDTTVEAFIPGL